MHVPGVTAPLTQMRCASVLNQSIHRMNTKMSVVATAAMTVKEEIMKVGDSVLADA